MTPTYDAAFDAVAAELMDAFPTWKVYPYPTSSLTDRSMVLAPIRSERMTPEDWHRSAMIGLFVPWDATETSIKLLDEMVMPLLEAIEAIPYVAYVGEIEGPSPLTVGTNRYFAQFVPITIETTN